MVQGVVRLNGPKPIEVDMQGSGTGKMRGGSAVTTMLIVVSLALSWMVVGAGSASANHGDPLSRFDRWILESRPVTIHRDGDAYRLKLKVTQIRGVDSRTELAVTLRSVSNPAGVTRAVQTYDYTQELYTGNPFTRQHNMSTAQFDDQGALDGDEALRLAFIATKSTMRRCDGHIRRRVGRLSGTVKFRTGSGEIGLITEMPRTAVLMHHDGDCPDDYTMPCPGNSRALEASRHRYTRDRTRRVALEARRREDSGSATINLETTLYLPSPTSPRRVVREIHAVVPLSSVKIADDLSQATIAPPRGSLLTGTLKAAIEDPEQPSADPDACGEPSRLYLRSTRGPAHLTGNLRGNFWIGADFRTKTTPFHSARAKRTVMAH